MSLFRKKSAPAAAAPPLAPAPPPRLAVTNETVLKLNLPNVFAFHEDETKAKVAAKAPAEGDLPQPRGTVLLVESDDEICRLLSRLLQHEGFSVLKASCLAEARTMIADAAVDFLLARRASVPLNLQTEIALRALETKTTVRIVDEFSDLILGQVVDYESLSQCSLGLTDLLLSLLEGANLGARGHSHNVAKYCRLVGQRLGLHRRDLDGLTLAACLHDLGSLEAKSPAAADPPAPNELFSFAWRATMELLANISFPYQVNDLLAKAAESQVVTPAAKDAESVPAAPLGARILRVVDAYDTRRRTEAGLADDEALWEWLRRQPAGAFDTDVLETLIHIRKHERAISAMNIFWAAVLVVDPAPADVQLLRLRLENDDYQVLVAKSLEEALHYLRTETITLVLSENFLGKAGAGFELLQTMKADPALRSIPFVFHAPAETDLIKQALEGGAEDWFPKPQNVEITAMKLQRIVGRVHASPAATDGVHGNLRDMGLIEMVQILSAGGRSVQITLESEQGTADLVLQNGQIISANVGALAQDAAVLAILRWTQGQFRIVPLKKAPPATITTSTDNLLLQACQQQQAPPPPPANEAGPATNLRVTP